MPSQTGITARWILTAVILASGIVFLDSTIVNVALRHIAADLPSSILGTLEGQAYVTSGYLATLSATLILAGAAADRYGRRRIFIIGLVAFGITSALCGLAPTMELLVVSRLLQGVAGALLVPGPLSIITASFEGTARARAFGLWSAATSALTIVGPLVGGILVDSLSWRVAFLVNVPLVLVALYAAVRHVPESRNEGAARRLDWLGSAVIAIAVGGISFGLIRGQEQHWTDPTAFLILAVGVVGRVAFPIMMLKRRDPLRATRPLPHPGIHGHQYLDLPDLRRALHLLVPPEPCSCRASWATPRCASAAVGLRWASCSPCSRPVWACSPRAWAVSLPRHRARC